MPASLEDLLTSVAAHIIITIVITSTHSLFCVAVLGRTSSIALIVSVDIQCARVFDCFFSASFDDPSDTYPWMQTSKIQS